MPRTRIGERNTFVGQCSIGTPPQDLKYHGEPTRLVVGARNVFREFMTAHRGTTTGNGQTVIGDDERLCSAHVAARDRTRPDAAVLADRHRADHRRLHGDECRGRDVGGFVADAVEGHGRERNAAARAAQSSEILAFFTSRA